MIHLKQVALTIHPFLSQQGIKMRKSSQTNIHTPQNKTIMIYQHAHLCCIAHVKGEACLGQGQSALAIFTAKSVGLDDPCGAFATQDTLGFSVQIPNCLLRTQSLLHLLGSQAVMHKPSFETSKEAHSR